MPAVALAKAGQYSVLWHAIPGIDAVDRIERIIGIDGVDGVQRIVRAQLVDRIEDVVVPLPPFATLNMAL